MDNFAPIVLFVYNRPEHTKRTVESLLNNTLINNSTLFIFSDGPKNDKDLKNVEEVKDYIRTIKGFDKIEIIEREKNFGLANSVISGVTQVIESYGKVIVLEDDMISSPYFLKYMNEVLNFFEYDQRIFSVTGYTFPIKIPEYYKYPVYLSSRSSSWGWGTWKNRWEKADWEIKDFQSFINDKSRVESFNKGGDD
ncbi:MAG: glycosyltransferase, partial [Ignavibacteria bacterium]|nr:glycosyltransferase [Ignavibacteria bacterium]